MRVATIVFRFWASCLSLLVFVHTNSALFAADYPHCPSLQGALGRLRRDAIAPGPRLLPRAEFPELYNYPNRDVIFYRGMSVRLDRTTRLERYMNLDSREYNQLNRTQRVEQIRSLPNGAQAQSIMRAQGSQGRGERSVPRLTMAVSEDLGQVLGGEDYGRTSLGGSAEPTIRILAEIHPRVERDPAVFVGSALPGWAQQEAALFFPPDPADMRWYFVFEDSATTFRTFEIRDRSRLAEAVEQWRNYQLQHPDVSHRGEYSHIEAALPALVSAGVLVEDRVLPHVARLSGMAASMERALREITDAISGGYTANLRRFLRNRDTLRELLETASPVSSDPRIRHVISVLKERVQRRLQGHPDVARIPEIAEFRSWVRDLR